VRRLWAYIRLTTIPSCYIATVAIVIAIAVVATIITGFRESYQKCFSYAGISSLAVVTAFAFTVTTTGFSWYC